MSESSVVVIVTGVVTIVTTIVTFLTLWLKLKYGVEKATEQVRQKIDANTEITTQTKEAASNLKDHTVVCTEEINRLTASQVDHDKRITALEMQMTALRVSVDNVTKNIDSTRHELRGHLQSLTNKLDLLATVKTTNPPPQNG